MGWLQRIFGQDDSKSQQDRSSARAVQSTPSRQPSGSSAATASRSAGQSSSQSVPPERMGLNGEYDQSGLAKRVAQAFDQDPTLDDIETLWVAQTGSTVVLKGKAPNQEVVSKMVSVARNVKGAKSVDTEQVEVTA